MALSGDVDLWGKVKTFEIKGYNGNSSRKYNDFNYLIPDTVTELFFTDEIKPESASVIDVDTDGDGGVVAWTENDGKVMKVSTQIKGTKVQAAKNSGYMFFNSKLTNIDFLMLDTKNVTEMNSMFNYCSGLTALDLSPLDTQNVTYMSGMFQGCSGLTTLDLSPLDTQKVTGMHRMFYGCSGLTALDLSSFDTHNVTNMSYMFSCCSGMASLDLTPLDTQKVTNMSYMFYNSSGLTSLDLSQLDTQNVKYMGFMFSNCSSLTTITTGQNFKFVGTGYYLSGTWQNTAGETFNGNNGTANFPSNVADTYTKISS